KLIHKKSVLLPKIEIIEAERLLAKKSYQFLDNHLRGIDKKYNLENSNRLYFDFIKARNLEKLNNLGQSLEIFKKIWINYPRFKTQFVSKKVDALSKKSNKKISSNDLELRLNSLFKNGVYKQFMKESKNVKDPGIKIMVALIKIKSQKRNEGRGILKDISEGGFNSTGSSSRDFEIIAESLYQLSIDDLKTSDNNSKIARNLKSILEKYPNYSKNDNVAYLSARLFTLDENYLESKEVYNWLIKTKSKDYLNDSLWGLGWSEYMLKNYENALNHFSSLEHSNKPYYQSKGLYWKGRSLEKLGHPKKAMDSYMKILENHKIGYYSYLASIKISPKLRPGANKVKRARSEKKHNLKQEMRLLFLSKDLKESKQEVESYIENRINSTNYKDYFRALESAQEFNMLIKLSYKYPSEDYYKYPKGFTDNIKIHSKNYNLDANLLLALIREESLFDPHAVSRVGAKGLMQLMDYTGEKIKRDLNLDSNSNFFDPELNIQIGTYYLASLIKEFDNNIFLALAAYNGGPKNVKKWLIRFDNLEDDEFVESIPFKETHGYVKRVLRSYFYYALDS
ncbi:MAG TPA: tetratricopeptide repeat protein, partial [Candidatus Dadabacteria bacterium]|nr:tetratricopeptide repeat protein [Candidatus Dadabacteria bacterium]